MVWSFICVEFRIESLCLPCTSFDYARLATMLFWVVGWCIGACEHSPLNNLALGSYPRCYAECEVKVIRCRSGFNP